VPTDRPPQPVARPWALLRPRRIALALACLLGAVAQAAPLQEPPRFERLDQAAALERAGREARSVALLFTSPTCAACKQLKRQGLASPEVAARAAGFVWVEVDVERNVSAAREHDVRATPELVVLAADGRTLGRALGALPGAELAEFLDGVGAAAGVAGDGAAPLRLETASRRDLEVRADGFRGRGICYSNVGYGPLDLPSLSPLQALRLGLLPRSPSTLAGGQWELELRETWVNVWSYSPDDRRLDYESLLSRAAVAYGLSDTVQIELELQDLSRFGGSMDGFIEAFHELFGLGQEDREDFPRGENVFQLDPQDGEPGVMAGGSGTVQQNVLVTLQHNVTCGTDVWPAFSYALSLRHPLGGEDQLDGPSDLDVGLSVAASRRFGSEVYGYLELNHVWFGSDEFAGIELERRQLSALVGLEWRYGARSSALVQLLRSGGAAVRREPFDDVASELTLGWKRELTTGTVLELGLIENVFDFDNSPDFGVHFGLTHRF
jgi:thioredoxin-related protein